ncbi:SDR family oxidoreductase [Bordetella petrii]|uniref:SDR family oxidoreductase n=1 Tax=Bordetella petrii TaxID=94624 RepID=UPI001A95A52A|nr:SDR family oxidoreductase [Bordetella petrii]
MFSADLLAGRVALVTGGAGGIGGAVVAAMAACGARVVAADLKAPDPAHAAGAEFVALDVTQAGQVADCVNGVVARHGRLDILVNVAGIVSLGNAADLAESEWDRVLAINLKGTFLCCQAVMPAMKAAGYGRIINMGSVLGKSGGNPRPWLDPAEQARASNVAYGVSKAGIGAMTAYLAKELAAHGITVNTVAPGPVASAMTTNFPQALRDLIPVGRMGRADEIAAAVLFLAAPQSSFITGETLDVNGGLWAD